VSAVLAPAAARTRLAAGLPGWAALPVHLGYECLAVLIEAPGAREAEPINIKAKGSLNVGYV